MSDETVLGTGPPLSLQRGETVGAKSFVKADNSLAKSLNYSNNEKALVRSELYPFYHIQRKFLLHTEVCDASKNSDGTNRCKHPSLTAATNRSSSAEPSKTETQTLCLRLFRLC